MTELMVSLALSSVVALAGIALTTVYAASFTDQLQTADLQENLWAAGDILAREIRKAGQGFAMCPEGRVQYWLAGATHSTNPRYALPPLVVTNNRYMRANGTFTSGIDADGPDLIDLYYGDAEQMSLGGDASLTANHDQANAIFSVSDVTSFAQRDFFVAWDPVDSTKRCALFQVTSINVAARQIFHAAGTAFPSQSPHNPPAGIAMDPFLAGASYSTGALLTRVGRLRRVQLFVRDPKGPRPQLMLDRFDRDSNNDGIMESNPFPVADGVEDLQISVACDRNGNGNPLDLAPETATDAQKRGDDFFPNVIGDLGAPCYDAFGTSPTRPPIAAVRLQIVTRTRSEGAARYQARPALEDRAAPSAGATPAEGGVGGYRRRVQTLLVSMRNVF